MVRNLPANAGVSGDMVQSLGRKDRLQEACMATHSNILAWRMPWTEESGRLQCIGLHRVIHN